MYTATVYDQIPIMFLVGPVPPLYVSFLCVGEWVHPCIEAELIITMKIKVVTLDEYTSG